MHDGPCWCGGKHMPEKAKRRIHTRGHCLTYPTNQLTSLYRETHTSTTGTWRWTAAHAHLPQGLLLCGIVLGTRARRHHIVGCGSHGDAPTVVDGLLHALSLPTRSDTHTWGPHFQVWLSLPVRVRSGVLHTSTIEGVGAMHIVGALRQQWRHPLLASQSSGAAPCRQRGSMAWSGQQLGGAQLAMPLLCAELMPHRAGSILHGGQGHCNGGQWQR